MTRRCWMQEHLAEPGPCDGRLVRAHLIPRQLMKHEGVPRRYLADPRGWVLVCGGPTGVGGHHGQLDHSRKLRVARWILPADVEEMAVEMDALLGREPFGVFLDREYGETWVAP